jgi:DNA-binding CsgD family transcriptional regulator/tetratricopeptide (TPR) repeat protein
MDILPTQRRRTATSTDNRAALLERLAALEQHKAASPQQQIDEARLCVRIAQRLNLASGTARALLLQARALATLAQYAEAAQCLHQALNLARRARDGALVKRVLGLLAGCEFELRAFESGARHCVELLDRADQTDDLRSRVWALILVGLAMERAALHERALDLFRSALALAETGYPRIRHDIHGHIGICLEALGRNRQAHAAFRRELTGYVREGLDVARAWASAKLALNQAIAGNSSGAQVLLQQALKLDASSGTPQTAQRIQFYAGAVYAHLHNIQECEAHLLRAINTDGPELNLDMLVRAHEMLGRVRLLQGDAQGALPHLDAAKQGTAILLAAAQDPHLDEVYRWLRDQVAVQAVDASASECLQTRAPPQRIKRFGPETHPPEAAATAADTPVRSVLHLSRKEARVLEHVAAGLSNAAIAQQLGVSPHTIRFHVSSLLTKLGAKRRAEAVAIALRAGLVAASQHSE